MAENASKTLPADAAPSDAPRAPPDDAFVRTTNEFWGQAAGHSREILIGAGVLMIGGLLASGVQRHQESKKQEAGAAVSRALKVAARPVAQKDDPAPTTPPPADEAPFATAQAKNEAVVAAFADVNRKFADSPAAGLGLLPLAEAEFALGKLDDAKGHYEKLTRSLPAEDPTRALGFLGLARIAEQKQDWTGAEKGYADLQRESPRAFLKDEAAVGKARMLEQQNKLQEAADAFAEVKVSFPSTEAARIAESHLGVLAGKGIKPPEKAAPAAPVAAPAAK